jgi:hypothetical protein
MNSISQSVVFFIGVDSAFRYSISVLSNEGALRVRSSALKIESCGHNSVC